MLSGAEPTETKSIDMERLTGAEALVRTLEHHGIDVVFGIPGGAILPTYDAIGASPIRHVLARHEQGAGHMAEGYAQARGRIGVVFATSGPGATNLVTPLMNALADSTPLLAITGQVPTDAIGTNAFQEAPTIEITAACTKRNWLVREPETLIDTIDEALRVACAGRPGPVLVDIPKDVQAATVSWHEPETATDATPPPPDPSAIRAGVELLEASNRPVLYVGGGVIGAGAHQELRRLAERARIPVVTTLMARGAFPDDHLLALGMPGMHGTYVATTAMQQADLLIAVGARFDDRVTGDPHRFAPHASVIHIDIDPGEIGKVRRPQLAIVADARLVLGALADAWTSRPTPHRDEWLETLATWRRRHPLAYHQPPDGPLKPQHVITELRRLTGPETIVVSGVGQHQMWTSQFWTFSRPRTWINSGGLGTMGFAIPAAIGAKVARPDRTVVAIDGDGCFQMTATELLTAAAEGIPITVVVLDNRGYGMVRQWQDLFYAGRRSASDFEPGPPDYVKLAESLGCVGLAASTPDDLGHMLETALSIDDRPVVVTVRVDESEMLWPMVAPGTSNDEILTGPDDVAAVEARRRSGSVAGDV